MSQDSRWVQAHKTGKTVRVDQIKGRAPHLSAAGEIVRYQRPHASHGVYAFQSETGKQLLFAGCASMLPLSEPCSGHFEDNQGFCHECGIKMEAL